GGGGGGGGGFSALPSTKATCYDGLKNCHDGACEEDIDCGGPCEPCPSCTDGIQNQGETEIDCGGPCTPCQEKILALKEDVTINIQIPDEITTGQLYQVNITIENTGDTTFKNLKIKIGDQIRTTNLDLTEKTTQTFHLTAPEKKGEYAIKAEAYTDTIHKIKEKKFRVTETTLILRAIEVDDILYITTKSNTADATIQLHATKNKKTVYINILDTKEHVTEIPAGNYNIKADLKKDNEVINTKKVTPTTEKTHTPTNLNMYLLTPLTIIDTALLIEILRNITGQKNKQPQNKPKKPLKSHHKTRNPNTHRKQHPETRPKKNKNNKQQKKSRQPQK
ncbi:MAG: hypothetical protein KAU03_02285, partial [Candidatus Altiarchaeales archaeon]|nr:hypothetical protein [Candidatus Altiarchaeales archaeon]